MAYLVTFTILFAAVCSITRYIGVLALTDMHIKVPEAVRTGSSVTLACDYDLESAALYTIKWYRDEVEFYRYVPKEAPPSQVFALPHLNVDLAKSNWKEVTLTNVERQTSGEYRCEVTADAPLFHTDTKSATLLVADIPEEGPVLKTEVQKVAPGEKIKANCTTPASYPSMNISWFINDDPVHSSREIHILNSVTPFEGLESVQSAISIRATNDRFKGGKMKLRCQASMFTLYASSKEVEIQEDAPQLALIMVPISHSGGVSRTSGSLETEILIVTGFLLFTLTSR